MDSHPLVELAHMLYKVRSTIVNGKRGLMELQGIFALSILRVKGDLEIWFDALIIALFPFTRWALVSLPVVVLFIVGERLA